MSAGGDASDAAAPKILDGVLTWSGTLEVGEKVVITYSVKVKEGNEGKIINNKANSDATPPGLPPITPPEVTTEHPIPGYTFTKTSDPESGATVERGGTITYTLTGTNTGATVLDPVNVTDDLSKVLKFTTLEGAPVATIVSADGTEQVAEAPKLEGTTMTWQGVLQVGQKVVITYTVKVKTDAPKATINNHAESTATPPGKPEITPPPVETEHKVPPVKPKPGLPSTGAGAASLTLITLIAGLGAVVAIGSRRRRVS